jgi:hypothetical protein
MLVQRQALWTVWWWFFLFIAWIFVEVLVRENAARLCDAQWPKRVQWYDLSRPA